MEDDVTIPFEYLRDTIEFALDMARAFRAVYPDFEVPAKVAAYLGADSIGYLTTESMVRATGRPQNEFCLACFNGDYPVPYDAKFDKLVMEQRRTKARLLEEPTDRLF